MVDCVAQIADNMSTLAGYDSLTLDVVVSAKLDTNMDGERGAQSSLYGIREHSAKLLAAGRDYGFMKKCITHMQ